MMLLKQLQSRCKQSIKQAGLLCLLSCCAFQCIQVGWSFVTSSSLGELMASVEQQILCNHILVQPVFQVSIVFLVLLSSLYTHCGCFGFSLKLIGMSPFVSLPIPISL